MQTIKDYIALPFIIIGALCLEFAGYLMHCDFLDGSYREYHR